MALSPFHTLSDPYLQIEVEDESKSVLTINTHHGLFRYYRPFVGVKTAPGFFQQVMDFWSSRYTSLSRWYNCRRSVDEHRRNLEAFFLKTDYLWMDTALVLKSVNSWCPQIKYLGYIADRCGGKPDTERTKANVEMPAPTNFSSLKSFLRLINFYANSIHKMSDILAPFDKLLRNEKFQWYEECHAFGKVKIFFSQIFFWLIFILVSQLL